MFSPCICMTTLHIHPPPLATMQPDSTSTEHGQTNHIRRWGGVQSLYLTTLHIHPPPPPPLATMQPDSTSTEHGQTNHIRRWGGVQSLYLHDYITHPPPPPPLLQCSLTPRLLNTGKLTTYGGGAVFSPCI